MQVLVAIPAYDRKVYAQTVAALLGEQAVAAAAGVVLDVRFIPGTSLIAHARNQAAREFLDSECDRLVFVDSDVSWQPGDLLSIAIAEPDFVGGAYRYKTAVESYPVHWCNKPELWADPRTGLIEVAALPGGFLSLSRRVFDCLREAHPDRAYTHGGHSFHAYFHCPPGQGEDGAFCADWRALGWQIWMNPMLTLTHVEGGAEYTGCIGAWLRRNAGMAA